MGIFDSLKKEIFPAEEQPIPNTLEDMVRSSKSPESGRARVIVVEPMRMEECNALVECIRHGLVVIINAERLEQEFARRIIDFLTGATRAIDGRSLRINQTTYIFAPSDVDVATRRKEPARKAPAEEPKQEKTPVHSVAPDEAANTVTDGLKKSDNFASFRPESAAPVTAPVNEAPTVTSVEPSVEAEVSASVSETLTEAVPAAGTLEAPAETAPEIGQRSEAAYGSVTHDTIMYGDKF